MAMGAGRRCINNKLILREVKLNLVFMIHIVPDSNKEQDASLLRPHPETIAHRRA